MQGLLHLQDEVMHNITCLMRSGELHRASRHFQGTQVEQL